MEPAGRFRKDSRGEDPELRPGQLERFGQTEGERQFRKRNSLGRRQAPETLIVVGADS